MKAKWTIWTATALLGLGLMASSAFAANTTVASPDQGQYVGWCDTTCHVFINSAVVDDTYPAAQPLQSCNDEVCIFW
jgi:hypothetical protein